MRIDTGTSPALAVGPMHPASHGDNSPAHAPGNRNPSEVLADLALALPVAFDPSRAVDAVDLAVTRSAVEACQSYVSDLAAILAARLTDLNADGANFPGSPRWIRTASLLYDAACTEGYDFNSYTTGRQQNLGGYSGRGMGGREVPALTLRDGDEAVVIAERARGLLGVPVRVDSLGRSWVVYPSRLVD